MIHDRLVHIFPTSSPSSIYKILIILYSHGMCPHAAGRLALPGVAVAAMVPSLEALVLHDRGHGRRRVGVGRPRLSLPRADSAKLGGWSGRGAGQGRARSSWGFPVLGGCWSCLPTRCLGQAPHWISSPLLCRAVRYQPISQMKKLTRDQSVSPSHILLVSG